jgi:hypothetical protein
MLASLSIIFGKLEERSNSLVGDSREIASHSSRYENTYPCANVHVVTVNICDPAQRHMFTDELSASGLDFLLQ